jgi:hypothetical protein
LKKNVVKGRNWKIKFDEKLRKRINRKFMNYKNGKKNEKDARKRKSESTRSGCNNEK